MKRKILKIILFFFLSSSYIMAEIIIIANKEVSIETLSKKTVADIYLGKKTKWGQWKKNRVGDVKKR